MQKYSAIIPGIMIVQQSRLNITVYYNLKSRCMLTNEIINEKDQIVNDPLIMYFWK